MIIESNIIDGELDAIIPDLKILQILENPVNPV